MGLFILSICISVISNRSVLCMVFIVSVDILVYIGEILINLQYFLGFSLYILWNPYYLSFSGFLSLVCVQVSSMLASGVRERDHCFVFVFLKQLVLIAYSFITLYIYLVFLDSPITCLSSVSITDLLCVDSDFQFTL